MKLVLQAGRAIAALAVLAYHIVDIMTKDGLAVPYRLGQLSLNGILGVNFFFTLSGFIILMAHQRDIGQPARLGHYGWRRAVRIYPIYWACLGFYLVASLAGLGSADFSWQPMQLFSDATLFRWTPLEGALPLRVSWTLFYEVQFYLIFAVLIFNRRLGMLAMAAWAGWIAWIYAGIVTGTGDYSNEICCMQFLTGMAAYEVYRRLSPRWYPALLSAGALYLALFVAACSGDTIPDFDAHVRNNLVMLSVAFAALLTGLVMAEDAGRIRVPASLVFLGNASYAIYLVHGPVMSVFFSIVRKHGLVDKIGFWPVYAAAITGGVAAGCVAHICCERPLLRWFQNRSKTGAPKIAASVS